MTVGWQKIDGGAVTGNNSTNPARSRGSLRHLIAVHFTAGSTPTVTLAIQGSLTGSATAGDWKTLVFIEEDGTTTDTKAVTVTKTATGWYFFAIYDRGGSIFPFYRVTLSANTNMTLDETYLCESDYTMPVNFRTTSPDNAGVAGYQ